MENFSTFSQYSCLKPNYEKCENAEIQVLKSVKVAVYGMKWVYLFKDTVIITAVHFSYNKIKQDNIKIKIFQKYEEYGVLLLKV